MKNIKDTLLKVFLIILLLLIIGLIGLVIYKTVVKDEPKTNNETNQSETNPEIDNQTPNDQETNDQTDYGLNIAQTNFNGVIKAAELGYAKTLQSNVNLTDGTCIMNGTAQITCTNGVIIDFSGVSPTEGIITFKAGVASVNPGEDLKLGDYYCNGNSSSFSCSLTKSLQG